MLKSITLENFFSFREKTTIHLNEGVNVLVGINGSGKSNFIKAIRLLYEGVAGIGFEKVFLQEWGGFDSVANFGGGQIDEIKIIYKYDIYDKYLLHDKFKYHFYEIIIHKSGSAGYYLSEHLYDSYSENSNNVSKFKFQKGEGKFFSKKGDVEYNKKELFNQYELGIGQISKLKFQFLPTILSMYKVYSNFETSFKSAVRQPSNYSIERSLQPNGENLTQLLNQIKNHQSLEYESIENLLKNVNPNFKDIGFDILGSKLYLVLREKALGKAVGLEHISDGTLRFLLLLSILYNSKRGSLVCLDEPEMGLHPDMINTICEGIKHASKTTQMIIATHSPLLLNSFELSDILIFEKNANNETIVFQKEESDFEDLEGEILPGQLWLMGKLGGKRW